MNCLERFACGLLYSKVGSLIPDKEYLCLLWRIRMGESLNLSNPTTYNEKLQWIKLYDHNPLYSVLVDKIDVKEWVGRRIGSRYLIPTYGVWESVDEIDWECLPDEFVINCSHDSGSVLLCRDKRTFDFTHARNRLAEGLKNSTYERLREWPYKNVKRRILAEKLLVDTSLDDLPDYKFYCFDGEVKLLGIYTNRNKPGGTKADYFDRDFKELLLGWGYPKSETKIERPQRFEEMIAVAEDLSKGIPEVRVDLYLCDEKVYFGEMTFFDGSGFAHFDNPEYDKLLGGWINLPEI